MKERDRVGIDGSGREYGQRGSTVAPRAVSTSAASAAGSTVTPCARERIAVCGWQTEASCTAGSTLASTTAISAITGVFGNEFALHRSHAIQSGPYRRPTVMSAEAHGASTTTTATSTAWPPCDALPSSVVIASRSPAAAATASMTVSTVFASRSLEQ